MRGIPDLVHSLSLLLPPWALGLLVAAAVALAVPGWTYSVRSKQIKGRLRQYARAAPEHRERLAAEALALAAGDGRRLVALAEEAIRLNQRPLWVRAMAELERLGTHGDDLARLRAQVTAERPRYAHPLQAAVAIQALLDAGMTAEATTRLEEALRAFPGDAELVAMAARNPPVDATTTTG